MSVASVELLRFILGLLGDPSKADAFEGDPSGAFAAAGLSNVSCADVDAITPLIANSVPGVAAMAYAGSAAAPAEMIQHIVKNVAVSQFDNNGLIQNVWSAGDVRQAFASDGGLALGGDLVANDPLILGDGNVVASDTAQAAGRDVIQNQADGNLALGGDQTIAQDNGVMAGGDAIAEGDKVGGNNNQAENTGNDNSVSVGGNQNNAGNTGNDNSVSVGGNQNNAENTGNATNHDQSTNIGDISVDLSDHSDNSDHSDHSTTFGDIAVDLSDNSDNSTTVGGNQNNAENTGNATIHDQSTTVGGNQYNAENTGNSTVHDQSTTIGDVTVDLSDNIDNSLNVGDVNVDLSEDSSVGGDYWEGGSNVGGIGNTDSRNSNNTSDSANTVVLTENTDNSLNVGTVAVDLSEDNSVQVGDVSLDASTTVGDVTWQQDNSAVTGDTNIDHSTTSGDTTNVDVNVDYDAVNVGDVTLDGSTTTGDTTWVDDHSTTSGDANAYTYDADYTYNDASVGGNFYEEGGSSYGDYTETNVDVAVASPTTTVVNDYTYDTDFNLGA